MFNNGRDYSIVNFYLGDILYGCPLDFVPQVNETVEVNHDTPLEDCVDCHLKFKGKVVKVEHPIREMDDNVGGLRWIQHVNVFLEPIE